MGEGDFIKPPIPLRYALRNQAPLTRGEKSGCSRSACREQNEVLERGAAVAVEVALAQCEMRGNSVQQCREINFILIMDYRRATQDGAEMGSGAKSTCESTRQVRGRTSL